MEMNAPIAFEMNVYAIQEETGNQAIAKMSLPIGQYPTPDTIRDLIKTATESFPDGYVLMNKKQFFNSYLEDKYNSRETFAVPGSLEFDENYIQGT